MREQYRCINPYCGIIIKTPRNMGGVRCHRCESLALPQPYNPNDKHVLYVPRKKRRDLNVNVSITDTEIFKCLLDAFSKMTKDDRIPINVKEEYKDMVDSELLVIMNAEEL